MSASTFRLRSTWVRPTFGLIGLLWLTLCMGASPALAAGAPNTGPEDPVVSVTTPQKDTILAELADTTEKRARGLMFRQSLAQDRGMLFIFPEPQQWTFWMKNTKIPLDIIWMDQSKRIVYIERNVPGCSRSDDGCPQYQPIYDALYVLEVAAGMADALKLQRGAKLQFQLPPSAQSR
jgi:uncharacterized protein